MKINICLADDHPVLLVGVQHELRAVHTLNVIGTARNSSEIMDLLSQQACHVLVTDFIMPGGDFGDGIGMLSFLRRRYPALKIVVFTTVDNIAMVSEMLRLGIDSVLNKVDDIGHLISAIHAVYAGATYLSPTLRTQGGSGHTIEEKGRQQSLSRREVEVVRLYVGGASVTEIAQQLNRTKQTVSSQKSSAMRKLGVSKDADLFRFAFESGVAEVSKSSAERGAMPENLALP